LACPCGFPCLSSLKDGGQMSHRMKLLSGSLLAALLLASGGCGETPTGASATQVAPIQSTQIEEAQSGVVGEPEATTQSDTTQRGGVLIGSGH
jgi:hypothetical protein